jgi:hypothetical protein
MGRGQARINAEKRVRQKSLKSSIKTSHHIFRILLICALLVTGLFLTQPLKPNPVFALACYFQPVSVPLNDLGVNEYIRMDGARTGVIGGLYLNSSNLRPSEHEAAGIALANQIEPLDASGQPDANGKIGLVSIGMSNNRQEFDTFRRLFDSASDPLYALVNPQLEVVSGSLFGGVLEYWSDPDNPNYNFYWDNLASQLTRAGLTHAQVQSVWIKTAEYDYLYTFPDNVEQYTARMKNLVRIVKEKFPNIKLAYLSSRTRSHWYELGSLSPEPYSFETGLAVRQVIIDQILDDPTLNFNPQNGPVVAPYLSWGPYLWIDGDNPRSDGRTWPVSYVSPNDCVHPETVAKEAAAQMLWDFFNEDSTAARWFLGGNSPNPTATPRPTLTPTPPTPANPGRIFLPLIIEPNAGR